MSYNPGSQFIRTSGYGIRNNPMGGNTTEYHPGVDFAASAGTPIPAPVSGIVQYSGFNSAGYGNTVILKATDGTFHLVAHMDGTSMPWAGEWIAAGTTIGAVGNTGRSTGPHLHYEIIQAGMPVSAGSGGSLGVAASNQSAHVNPDSYSGAAQYDSGAASSAAYADFLGAYSFTKAYTDPFTASFEELLAATEISWSNPNVAAPLQSFLDRTSGQPGWGVSSIPGGYSITVPRDATGSVADLVGTGLASTMATFLSAQKRAMTVYSTQGEVDGSYEQSPDEAPLSLAGPNASTGVSVTTAILADQLVANMAAFTSESSSLVSGDSAQSWRRPEIVFAVPN